MSSINVSVNFIVTTKVIIDNSVVDNLYGTFIYMTNGKVELNNNSKIIN